MSFGLDVRWRKASMKKLAAPGGSVVIDLPAERETSVARSRRPEWCPSDLISPWACSPPPAPEHHWCTPTSSPCPCGRIGRRRHVRLRAPQPDRTAGLLRRGRSRRASGRTDRISRCLTAREPDPAVRTRHLLQPIVPVIGGLLSEGRAYKYLPKSVAYLPPWPELRPARSGRVRRHRTQGVHRRSPLHGDPGR